ncbi:MAG: glycoside-pentoside-hexuronide (GPH):cation symporter [Clostridiales bacterium]|nr:glycoside-pentoside-hexuronide (GPH):cation symporter [Clostridiales bacterium]
MGAQEKRLSKGTLIAYGLGDFASNLTNTFMGSYLSLFYTDVVGLAPAVVSVIMLIARIWDGVNDPMFGAIAERTHTKRGRFRPYIFYVTPFLALSAVLVFTKLGSGTTSVIWAAVTYIAYGMLFTVVNLSYGSLSTVMTANPQDISLLTSYRMMGTNLSSVLLSAISPLLLQAFSGSAEYTVGGYTKLIFIYSLCSVPLFYLVYAKCRETIVPVGGSVKFPVSQSIKYCLTNKPLMIIFVLMIISMTAFFGRMAVVLYYILYVVQRPDLISIFMALPSIMTVIGIFLTKNYILKFGKKKMAAIGYIGAGITLIVIFFADPSNIGIMLVLHGLYGLFCFSFPIPMSMIPEAINYQEARAGIRTDGMAYACTSLSTKFGNAFGPSVALLIMGSFGYIANAQQTPGAIEGINLAVNLIFGILYLVTLIPLFFYPLDEQKNEVIREILDARRDGKPENKALPKV